MKQVGGQGAQSRRIRAQSHDNMHRYGQTHDAKPRTYSYIHLIVKARISAIGGMHDAFALTAGGSLLTPGLLLTRCERVEARHGASDKKARPPATGWAAEQRSLWDEHPMLLRPITCGSRHYRMNPAMPRPGFLQAAVCTMPWPSLWAARCSRPASCRRVASGSRRRTGASEKKARHRIPKRN